MVKTNIKSDEAKRLEELRSYQILDSLSDEAFDNLTKLASEITDMPIALINFTDEDRQWTNSMVGILEECRETPLTSLFVIIQ